VGSNESFDGISAVIDFSAIAKEQWQEIQNSLSGEILLKAAELIENSHRQGGRLHFSGIGKASYVAAYSASLFSSTGTPSYVLHGTEAVHGSCGQLSEQDVVIMISNSGKTEELLQTAMAVQTIGCSIIAVTGDPGSPLANLAKLVLPAHVSQEGGPLGRAPRMSVMAELYVLMALSVLLQSRVGQTPAEYLRCHPGGTLGKSGLKTEPVFEKNTIF